MKKAVIYVRVSSKEQEEHGFSIPAQKKLLKEYAEKKQLKVVKIFEEVGTARKDGRKQFNELIKYVKKNPDVCVLVEKTDRLYRNFMDKGKIDILNSDTTIHLVKENQILSKSSNSRDNFTHNIHTAVATLYSQNLSEEVKKGMKEKAEQGIYPNRAPIGYKNQNKVIVKDIKTSHLILELFKLASQGKYSLNSLSNKMFSMGLTGAMSGKKLSTSQVSRMLQNEFYTGNFYFHGKFRTGKHEGIVPMKLFNQVQNILSKNGVTITRQSFSYAGIFKCKSCGCSIVGEKKTKSSGKIYIYYHCTNGKGDCDRSYIREEKIEEQIMEIINQVKVTPSIINWTREALKSVSKDEGEFRKNQVKFLNRRYLLLDKKITDTYDDKLEGKIDEDFWREQTNKWKKEQVNINDKLKRLSKANSDYMEYGLQLMECLNLAPKLFTKMLPEEKRSFVNTLLSNPTLNDATIEYHYRKPFNILAKTSTSSEWLRRRDSNPRPSD